MFIPLAFRYVRPYCYKLGTTAHNSGGYLRDWVLEGKRDDSPWVTLMNHEQDQSFKNKTDIQMWPIFMIEEVFNSFRIRMTGVNSNGNYQLRACNFEIYGQLLRIPLQLDEEQAVPTSAEASSGGETTKTADDKSSDTAEAAAVSRAAPVKLQNPQWFTEVHSLLRMMQFFISGKPKALPQNSEFLESKAVTCLSREGWRDLTDLMNKWSSRNEEALPDPSKISVKLSNLTKYSHLIHAGLDEKELKVAMTLLSKFNHNMSASFSCFDLQLPPNQSCLTDGFRACSDLVFYCNKKSQWQNALKATLRVQSGSGPEITVDPMRAGPESP